MHQKRLQQHLSCSDVGARSRKNEHATISTGRRRVASLHAERQATFLAFFFLKKNQLILCLCSAAVTKVPELCPLLSRFLAPGHSIQAGLAFAVLTNHYPCTYGELLMRTCWQPDLGEMLSIH